jgi:hypothetical protein
MKFPDRAGPGGDRALGREWAGDPMSQTRDLLCSMTALRGGRGQGKGRPGAGFISFHSAEACQGELKCSSSKKDNIVTQWYTPLTNVPKSLAWSK